MTAPAPHYQPKNSETRQHTPTPWAVEENCLGVYPISAKQGPLSVQPAKAFGESDAAFIVEAVNNYTRLTERCEQYKGQVKAGSDEIDALKARNEALEARQVDDLVEFAIMETRATTAEARIHELESRLQTGAETFGEACKRIDVLEGALKPFADIAKFVTETQRDTRPINFGMDQVLLQRLTIGHLRAARAVVSPDGNNGEGM